MQPHTRIGSELGRETRFAPLVRAARRGDERAWESLVRQVNPLMRRVVHRYGLSAADVEDVVQQSWATAFVHLGELRDPESIRGWLCVIARREALRTLRRRAREITVDAPFAPEEDEASVPGPESALLRAEETRTIREAMDRLPPRQGRLLHVMLRSASASYAEVSRRLAMPVGSIGPTRERALARLRRDRVLRTALR